MAKESDVMQEAVVTLKNLTDDEKIKLQCKARKRYEADQKAIFLSGKEKGIAEGILKGVEALILDNIEENKTEQQILEKLMKRFSISQEMAEEYLHKYMVR